jgi:acyl-CoA-dependent ceramide synthase
LKYLGYTNACDFFFGLFVVTWVITRHIFYPMVCWSIYAHTSTDMAPGCYLKTPDTISLNPNSTFIPASQFAEFDALGGNAIWANLLKAYTDREGPICWNPTIRYSFLALLLALQGIICFWFALIVKVVYKVVSGQGADDVRSDDEGDDEEEVEKDITHAVLNAAIKGAEWVPVEEEVGVESLSFASRKSTAVNGGSVVGVGVGRKSARRSTSRASGISLDRKELLGRIGCDKPS